MLFYPEDTPGNVGSSSCSQCLRGLKVLSWIKYEFGAALPLAAADVCLNVVALRISTSLGVLIYGSCTFSMGL
jgi:hypothetical protein